MSWRLVGMLMLACAACGPSGRDPEPEDIDGGVDAPGVIIDAAPAECYANPTDVDVAAQGQVVEACALWNSLAELAGHATVSRSGTGLMIDFGNGVVFTGSVINGTVSLLYEHLHPYTDGCQWKATETMTGTLDPASCNFSLRYGYVESVAVSDGFCDMPCSAQANVTLQLTPIP